MLAAYCWPQSGQAGASIDLHLSADRGPCSVTVARIGADATVVAEHDRVETSAQPVPDDAAASGCAWEASLTVEIPAAWRSGFYLVTVVDADGESAEAFFVVRAQTPSEALLVLSTSTWAAYNDWGGPSYYTGGHVSSLRRPLPRGFLDKPDPHRYRVARFAELADDEVRAHFDRYSYWSAAAGWSNWERLFVAWAEQQGLALDFATSIDLATEPGLLTPYRLYLSVGHDEYWSASMRDAVEGWVDDGGAAVFLSGNTSFWQVRFEDGGERMIGYKTDIDLDPVVGTDAEHTVSTMWSDPLCHRPENEMTGVSFTRGGYARVRNSPKGSGGYTVWRPDHWAFEGVPLRTGDLLGVEPVVVGYECDGCELQLVDGRPVPTGAGGTPVDLEVLATAPANLWLTHEVAPGLSDRYIGELNWVAERLGGGDTEENRARYEVGNAVMGYFRRGDGEVFTTGCTDWAYGLGDDSVAQVTRNVVSRYVDLKGARDGHQHLA